MPGEPASPARASPIQASPAVISAATNSSTSDTSAGGNAVHSLIGTETIASPVLNVVEHAEPHLTEEDDRRHRRDQRSKSTISDFARSLMRSVKMSTVTLAWLSWQ